MAKMTNTDRRPGALSESSVVPLRACELQPSDAVIWEDGHARYTSAHVDYLVIPPNDHVVDLVCPDGRRIRLDRDQPVVAVRGSDWRLWLGSAPGGP